MPETPIAPLVLDGWFILHQFFQAAGDGGEGAPERAAAFQSVLAEWEDLGDRGWTGLYRIVGGGADFMLVHFRPSLEELAEVEKTLGRHVGTTDFVQVDDYVSVVELGMYHLTAGLVAKAKEEGIEIGSEEWQERVTRLLAEEREKRFVKERLHPRQPDDMPYVCFYPMDKRRNEGQNWYTLPLEERAAMMRDHGATGRRYAGRISQVISGSIGFDDWEWAVTLFGRSPNDFKALVTEMRYDRVSAVYAEFGSFWVGYRVPTGRIAGELAG
jgi:chlorite dismutase